MDEAQITIAAPPEAVYDLVADVTNMGRWSPECHRCAWHGDATGPATGARFKGWNKAKVRGLTVGWSTVSTVKQADPGKAFSFETKQSGARWTYRFAPDGEGGCVVTETREDTTKPFVARVFGVIAGNDVRDTTLVDGMHKTLERLKAAAES
ncbi:MAG: hypothetical protein JWN46_725 [Acidimicrobiales bacterium]|nr:hypothetical protein [Acidimicrobiales bacterium]